MKASAVTVVINSKFTMAPVEMSGFEAAYCLMKYTIARTDTSREDANSNYKDVGTAAIYRRFPEDCRVLLDSGNSGESSSRNPGLVDWSIVVFHTIFWLIDFCLNPT